LNRKIATNFATAHVRANINLQRAQSQNVAGKMLSSHEDDELVLFEVSEFCPELCSLSMQAARERAIRASSG
jgi:hypothetical protein